MARKTISAPCAQCGKILYREPRKLNPNQENLFCNRQCWSEWKRTHLPEGFIEAAKQQNELRREQGVQRNRERTRTYICDYCGSPFQRNTKWAPRIGTFCSRTCVGLGSEALRWRGYTEDNQSRQSFQQAVRRRFVDKCAICGWHETSCDVHHIAPRRENGPHTFANTIILCPNHHRMADRGKIKEEALRAAQQAMIRKPGVPDRAFF